MVASSSGWSNSQKEEIIRIAENAIENITRLTDSVWRSSLPSHSSSSSGSLPSTNALQELQRRFPTVNSRGRNTTRARLATVTQHLHLLLELHHIIGVLLGGQLNHQL